MRSSYAVKLFYRCGKNMFFDHREAILHLNGIIIPSKIICIRMHIIAAMDGAPGLYTAFGAGVRDEASLSVSLDVLTCVLSAVTIGPSLSPSTLPSPSQD